ncbi:MAG: carbohydrate-binding module family 20 domain-containing protein, partial [bacterium]
VRLDRALPPARQVAVQVEDRPAELLEVSVDAAGDGLAHFAPHAGWDAGLHRLVVRPAGWKDTFPLMFHHPVRSADALADSVPGALRPAALPDPAGVTGRPGSALDALLREGAGAGYNRTPYVTPAVHAGLPGRATAVGGARSWVAEAPFKHVYLCLDGRDAAAEAATGAPSGAGWHAIGDPAESLVNSLEAVSLLVGWGGRVFAADERGFAFGEGEPAYGLGDIATFSRLQPGEALVTGRDADAGPPVFHWYGAALVPACVEIWVHPCGLDADETFACRPTAVQLQVRGAHTAPGENIYLVGDHPALGAWDPTEALPLAPAGYPTWLAETHLPPGATIRFKAIRKDAAGRVTWSGGHDGVDRPLRPRAFHGVDWIP